MGILRELKGLQKQAIRALTILYALFHIYTIGFMQLPDMQQRAIHAGFGIVLTFLLFAPWKGREAKSRVPIGDLILVIVTIIAVVNVYLKHVSFAIRPTDSTILDLFLAGAIVLLALEAVRRTLGWTFFIMAAFLIMYALFGQFIPGTFGHRGFSLEHVLQTLYQTNLGLWGFITGISATIVAIFIIFGAFLTFSGGGQTFMDIALKIAGRVKGGPALVAVMSSALFGTLSGSTVANVLTTGVFTIPLMKRLGYNSSFAGAVEATASTGGAITPPIMAAGAFIMAEFLGISYLRVALAAAIPAALYYLCVAIVVRLQALRKNLSPVPRDEIPLTRNLVTWSRLGPFLVPLATLFAFMLLGYSPARAGFYGFAAAAILFFFSGPSLSGMKTRFRLLLGGLEQGAIGIVWVVSLMACANIVVGLINLTGLGIKLSAFIVSLAGVSSVLAIILAAIVAIILGMGLPTTAAYIMVATVVAPGLISLGFAPLSVHMFLFYFAVLSSITPPVCPAAFAAAGIAKTSWSKVAFEAMKLAGIAFVIPFIFLFNNTFLFIGTPALIIYNIITAVVGLTSFGIGITGYITSPLGIFSRICFLAGSILLIVPGSQTDLIGLFFLVGGVIIARFWPMKRVKELAP